MPLDLPTAARFPREGADERLPSAAVEEFYALLLRIAGPRPDRKNTLEVFKRGFYLVEGRPPSTSSSSDYAAFDLRETMYEASKTPQLFLEALYDGIESVRAAGTHHVPDIEHLNEICRHNAVPFQ